MAASMDKLTCLPDVQRNQLESLLVNFDQTWTTKSLGYSYRRLATDDDVYRQVALEEMVKIDLERGWSLGASPSLEDYMRQFPELGTHDTVSLELIRTEYEIRLRHDQHVELSGFGKRFPERFDDLRHSVQHSHILDSDIVPQSNIDTSHTGNTTETHSHNPRQPQILPTRFGRYHIIRRIGEGAMGSVYLARDTQLGREVALKTPHFSGEDADELIQRFYREARTVATLQHPNICAIYDVGEIDSVHYITMAFIDGHTLAEYTHDGKQQTERKAASTIRTLALALQHAHGKGIVHRDLKPANIIIDRNCEPLLMDFGLACRTNVCSGTRITQTGALLGTPAYMSPEQVEGPSDTVGRPSDIYSLGVILYELLCGQLPFDGSVGSVLGKILTQEPREPSVHRPELDWNLEAICLKMMAKRAEDRYPSMAAVSEALTQYLQGDCAIAVGEGVMDIDANQVEGRPGTQKATELRPKPSDTSARTIGTELPQPQERWHRLSPNVRSLAGYVGVLVVIMLAIVVLFPTRYGTVRVVVPDDRISVFIDGRQLTGAQRKEPQKLTAGTHTLEMKIGDRRMHAGETDSQIAPRYNGPHKLTVRIDDVEIVGNNFEIVRGQNVVAEVSLIPAPLESRLLEVFADHDAAVECVAFVRSDSSRFISNDKRKLILRDGDNMRELLPLHGRWITSFSLSHDGDRILSGSWGVPSTVVLRDLESGDEIFQSPDYRNAIQSVAVAPNGKRGLSAGWDETIRLWDLENGQELLQFKDVKENIECVAFCPHGNRALSGGRKHIVRLWNASDGTKVREFIGHTNVVMSVAFSPDGRQVLSGGWDNTARLWDVETGGLVHCFEGHTSPVWCVAFSPDGKFVFSGSGGALDKGGNREKDGDNVIRIWDAETGQGIHRLTGHADAVQTMDVSADGRFLVSGSRDRTVRLWRLSYANQQEDIVNSVGMKLVLIDPRRVADGGRIQMGSPVGESGHRVCLATITTNTETRGAAIPCLKVIKRNYTGSD